MPSNLQGNLAVQLLFVLIVSGAIIYIGMNVWPDTNSMEVQIKGLQEDITRLQKIVDEGRALEARLPELRREIKAKELELEQLKKIIPTDKEAQDLIRKLERMAAETNIVVRSWTSQPTNAKEFYLEWPIAITAGGSYHSLGKFFSKISNYARIINVQNVKIGSTRSTNPAQTIEASFTAVTYVYKEGK